MWLKENKKKPQRGDSFYPHCEVKSTTCKSTTQARGGDTAAACHTPTSIGMGGFEPISVDEAGNSGRQMVSKRLLPL